LCIPADQEERRLDALCGQRVEHRGRRLGIWSVVESKDNLVVAQRQSARIGLEADLRAAFRAEFQNTFCPQRVGRTGLRLRIRRKSPHRAGAYRENGNKYPELTQLRL
jgi:hypothetical protein